MELWVYHLTFLAVVFIAVYLLYRRGAVVSKSICAALFAFRPGKSTDRITLGSCTGWVRHRVRLRESGEYEFTLTEELTAGEAAVTLLDREKRQLLRLDRQCPGGRVELEAKGRYYLSWEFSKAAGRCELRW